MTDFLENKFSDELISNYRDDLDFQNVVDWVQTVSVKFSIKPQDGFVYDLRPKTCRHVKA